MFGRETERERQRAQEWTIWMQQRNPLAIASAVLGIFSVIEIGAVPIFSLGGFVLGIVALRQLRRPGNPRPLGKRLAWMGTILSGAALTAGACLYLHLFPRI